MKTLFTLNICVKRVHQKVGFIHCRISSVRSLLAPRAPNNLCLRATAYLENKLETSSSIQPTSVLVDTGVNSRVCSTSDSPRDNTNLLHPIIVRAAWSHQWSTAVALRSKSNSQAGPLCVCEEFLISSCEDCKGHLPDKHLSHRHRHRPSH